MFVGSPMSNLLQLRSLIIRSRTDTDATGHPTVGYGHLCHDSTCSDAGFPIPLSVANGKNLLAKDMAVSSLHMAQCFRKLMFFLDAEI